MDQTASVANLKNDLRRSARSRILALGREERAAQEAALVWLFDTLPGYAQSGTVLLYGKAFAEELETWPFFIYTLKAGKRVVLPKVDRREQRLLLFQITDPTVDLEPGSLKIPEPRPHCLPVEPEEIDWALVPGLAFDFRCHRLGRGAGYYDRLLPLLRPGAPRWALGFDCQVVDELPAEPHDMPIDGVATPLHWIKRRAPGVPEFISS